MHYSKPSKHNNNDAPQWNPGKRVKQVVMDTQHGVDGLAVSNYPVGLGHHVTTCGSYPIEIRRGGDDTSLIFV